MNIRKHFVVGILILFCTILFGCTTMPMYQNGRYVGSSPTWDAGRATGMGTGAIIGTLGGLALGNPVAGGAMGAAVGGMISQPEPLYIPGPQLPNSTDDQQQQPQSGITQQNNQALIPPPPPPPPKLTCKEQYDRSMGIINFNFQTRVNELNQFRSDTGDDATYFRVTEELKTQYFFDVKRTREDYAVCVGK